jgi:hypothetical protein
MDDVIVESEVAGIHILKSKEYLSLESDITNIIPVLIF